MPEENLPNQENINKGSTPNLTAQGVPADPQKPVVYKRGFHIPRFILILIGLLLLLALLEGGFYLFKNQMGTTTPPQKTEEANKVVVTPTPDPTVGWETYIGKNFTFKYPADWFTSPGNQSVTISDVKAPGDIPVKILPDGHQIVQIAFFEGKMPTNFPEQNGVNELNPTIKAFSVNGYSGIRGNSGSTIGTIDNVYLKNPSEGYIVLQKQLGNEDTFNQILSTFKFTDASETSNTDTSGWKTYKSPVVNNLGYTIKTPENWKPLEWGGNESNPSPLELAHGFLINKCSSVPGGDETLYVVHYSTDDSYLYNDAVSNYSKNIATSNLTTEGGLTVKKFIQKLNESNTTHYYYLIESPKGYYLLNSSSHCTQNLDKTLDSSIKSFKFTQ
jgi:hypothetical protein